MNEQQKPAVPGAPKLVGPAQASAPQAEEVSTDAILSRVLAGGDVSQVGLLALVNLLMAKEKRVLAKEAELAQRDADRDAADRANCEQFTAAKIEAQRKCRHLKGGKTRQRGNQKDYNVYSHRFADGKVQIKCNDCAAKWFPGDTREYLKRNGMTIPNWTEIGWRDAVLMCEESSNKPSASELAKSGEGYFVPSSGGQRVHSGTGEESEAKQTLRVPNVQL